MKKRILKSALLLVVFSLAPGLALPFPTHAAEARVTVVDVNSPGLAVPPTLHGLFFEDINYGADGGLYAELVQNRSFEDHEPFYAWAKWQTLEAKGRLTVESESPLNGNSTFISLRIYVVDPGTEGYGVVNSGFDGMVLRASDNYLFSVYARRRAGDSAALHIALEDAAGQALAATNITGLGDGWTKFEATLTSTASVTNARLVVLATQPGVVDVDMVSLIFPQKTFRGRRNGLRADPGSGRLADMKPGFLRFPGGCIVEGRDFGNMYRWKDTIGDVSERKQNWDLWQDSQSPEYNQTYGLGFFEYFQFCEGIGAEPVPVVNCGMCCQARRGPPCRSTAWPLCAGCARPGGICQRPDQQRVWGARRAAMGHPAPFNLKFIIAARGLSSGSRCISIALRCISPGPQRQKPSRASTSSAEVPGRFPNDALTGSLPGTNSAPEHRSRCRGGEHYCMCHPHWLYGDECRLLRHLR